MSNRRIDRLFGDLGDLLEEHEGGADLDTFTEYRDSPVAFVREVIGDEPWARQVDIMEAVRDNRNVTVRSCNAAGKSQVAAWLALWWCYARQGLAVLTAPTETQLSEQIMRRYLWQGFSKAKPTLPGRLGVNALRPRGEGAAGIVAKTATGVSALTGFHDATAVLYVIDEAQDYEKLDPHAWDAAFAICTGEGDRKLSLGNPLYRAGRFFRSHKPGSNWTALRIPASDVPNVREGETVIPGLITREAISDMESEYGRDSGYVMARRDALFPVDDDEGLFKRSWLDSAAERHRIGKLADEEYENRTRYLLACDIARHGKDRTVVAVRRGRVLERFESWRGADTEETVERIRKLAWDIPSSPFSTNASAVKRIVVDAVAVGGGVVDRLKTFRRDPWSVREYKGSRSAKKDERFRNLRAEAFWRLRKALERDEAALPDDEGLFEELLAVRWRPDGRGRVVLESKRDMAKRLGRSPDLADAAAMAFHRNYGGPRAGDMIVKW